MTPTPNEPTPNEPTKPTSTSNPPEATKISEYEIYLGVPTLLSLQKPAAERTHRDEHLRELPTARSGQCLQAILQ